MKSIVTIGESVVNLVCSGEGEFPLAAGSGDRFFGAFLFGLAKKGVARSELARLSDEEYSELLQFAFEYAAKRTGE